MNFKISERNFSELSINIYLLQKGVRDCALLSINLFGTKEKKLDELFEIEQYIISSNLYYHILKYTDDDEDSFSEDLSIYVFKYPHQRMVIDTLENDKRFTKGSFMFEYLRGTLLGYSGEEMEKYLSKLLTDNIVNMKRQFKNLEGGEENVPESEQTSEV